MEGTGEFKDITYYNPSLANAAGDMISNADDLNKFFSSLLGGKLLKERELKEMLTTVPIEGKGVGDAYGLGIYETKLPNGVSVWGMEEEFLDLQLLLGSNWRQTYISYQS